MLNLTSESLSNGLPLFIRKAKKAPVVTLQVWVRTGSADERSNEAGISHFIEHLVFKGTKTYKAGEIAQVVEEAGGELNAYTSFDQTVFYVTVPKEKFEVAASVLSEMVSTPLFDETEVNNEREVVVEEIKMGLDQPNRVASKMLFGQMFQGHPYSLPVIGTQENVERVTVEEIQAYFKERYVASNMSLVCVGDVEDHEVKKVLEEKFHSVASRPEKTLNRERSSVQLKDHENYIYQKSDFERSYFYLSWSVEGFKNKNSEAYEILGLLMGQGESSYLYKKLKLEKDLCRSVGASYFGTEENGIFVVNGVCMNEELEAFFIELPKVLSEFCSLKDISTDLAKAKNIYDSEQSYAEESISSQCRIIGDDWLYYNEYGEGEKRKERILSLNPTDLSKALKRILQTKPFLSVLAKQEPQTVKSSLSEVEKLKNLEVFFVGEEKSFLDKIKKEEGPSFQKHWKTSGGRDVVFVKTKDSEVVSFKLAFKGGEILASDNQVGLNSLFGSTWGRETKDNSEQDLAAKLDYYCSSFSAFSGKHSVGLNLYTLTKFFENLEHLFLDMISKPCFSESVLAREKNSKLQILESIKDRPAQIAFQNFSKLIFEGSVYGRNSVGEEAYLKTASTGDLESFLKSNLSQQMVFSVVGDLTEDQVNKVVSGIEKSIDAYTSSEKDLFLEKAFEITYQGGTKELASDKNQSHIVLAYPGVTYNDDKALEIDLATAILGGQGGRLFIELRDKKSLAYSVAPIDFSGFYGGYFGSYIACDPSKKDLAVKMMREELQKMADHKVSSKELDWMKNQVLGRQSMALQKNSYICDQVLFDTLYGKAPFDYQNLSERVHAVTAEQIQKTIQEILSGPEYLVSVG